MNLVDIEKFATLTGSSVVPGVEPNDLDYFALWDKDKIEEVKEFVHKHPILWADDPSIVNWTDAACFKLNLEGKKIDLFFVHEPYFSVLVMYTKLLKELCRDGMLRMYLQSKPNRAFLCESLRRIEDGRAN